MKLFAYLITGFLVIAAGVYLWPQPKLVEGAPVREFVIELVETDSFPVSEETIKSQLKMTRQRLLDAEITGEVISVPNTTQIIIHVSDTDTAAHEEVRKLISQPRILSFHLVHPDSDRLADAVVAGEEYVAEYEVRTLDNLDEDGAVTSTENLLITSYPVMDGSSIKKADGGDIPNMGCVVIFEFDQAGTQKFFELTRDNVGSRLAIVIDDKILTAPNLMSPIAGGSAQISGMANEAEAHSLASALEKPLLHRMKLLEERTTTP